MQQTVHPQELTEEQLAIVADRARVWEVRRFCQVLPSMVKYERGQDDARERHSGNEPDGALAALLRCVIYQVNADLAMVSLLDDHTQYFLSGASRPPVADAKVTIESTQWYGCESVTHHGGLCERTITQQNCPGSMAFYEELDMAGLERTKCLPFVDGTIARFRYYAGVPLNPYNGPNIGTVFLFNEQPCDAGTSAAIRLYLTEIAVHITKHLEQAVEALEGKRVLRFNRGIEALVKTGTAAVTDIDSKASLPDEEHGRQPLISNHFPDFALRIYQSGAALLQDIFDFDGVRIQEMRATGDFINRNPNWNGSRIMAQYLQTDIQKPGEISDAFVDILLETFPAGAVFQIASESGAVIAATSANAMPISIGDMLAAGLLEAFPQAEQVILMPLWDPHFERNIGAVLGYACDQSRVYLSGSDLSSMSAFCTTLMTQVRRLEVQATDRIKSDFLGSVSHELRTPLQGILSSLELLTDTSSNELQHELVQMARYSGMSLLDIINRILHFSKISSRGQLGNDVSAQRSTGRLSKQPSFRNLQSVSTSSRTAPVSIIDVCENVIQGAAQRLRLKKNVRPELFDPRHVSNSQRKLSIDPSKSSASAHPLTIVFDTNAKNSCRLIAGEDFETVLMNLLDNAIKFGDHTGCVRVRLDIDEASVRLSVGDTGKGIAPSFIRHAIFDPFSQEDPASEGTGLGLPLVKRTVTALGGSMLIDSDEAWGSDFTAMVSLSRLVSAPLQTSPDSIAVPLPRLEMNLYPPRRWATENDARGQRCTKMMGDSLARVVSRWFTIDNTRGETPEKSHRLSIVLLDDLNNAENTYGDVVDRPKIIVLCPDLEGQQDLPFAPSQDVTSITGPVTVTAVYTALSQLFPSAFTVERDEEVEIAPKPAEVSRSSIGPLEGSVPLGGTVNEGSLPQLLSHLSLQHGRDDQGVLQAQITTGQDLAAFPGKGPLGKSLSAQASNPERTAQPVNSPSTLSDQSTGQPKIMLVDDNAVNLKVLGMFARKCSSIPPVSVGSGQAAIYAFKDSLNSATSVSQPYDVIFLDLSMPEVSGFDVAEEIRRTEARLEVATRTHICALTALTSSQDRNMAYASGVDDFLVKPARFQDLQAIIKKWRTKQAQCQ